MEHTYLRYECADSFGSVVSTGSSRAPVSNSLLQFTPNYTLSPEAAGGGEVRPSLLWSTTGSSVTAYSTRTGQPLYKFAHRDPDSSSVGSGLALNSSECSCLDTFVESREDDEQQQTQTQTRTRIDSMSTSIRIATGWIDGAVRVFELTRGEWERHSKPLGFAHSFIHRGGRDSDHDGELPTNTKQDLDFIQREPLVLNGHVGSPVRVVRFEPQETRLQQNQQRRLASGGSDGIVVVWDVIEEVGLFRLVGHNRGVRNNGGGGGGGSSGGGGGITDLAFVALSNPDGALDGLVSSCADGLVKVWDLSLQCCVQTIVNHPGPVLGMDCHNLSPISSLSSENEATEPHRWRLATGSVDGLVRVWSVQAPRKIKRGNGSRPELDDTMDSELVVVPQEPDMDKVEEGTDADDDMCCQFMGTISPPPNAATAHHHQKIASVRWYHHRFLGVLRADSKFVDVYQVHTEREATKRKQRRLRRRKEKSNKKKIQEGNEAESTQRKRGILDDPESSASEGDEGGDRLRNKDAPPIDPERIKASDELEYLTTVMASHKVRSFVLAPVSSPSPGSGYSDRGAKTSSRPLVQVVCALGTNAIESYNIVRTKDPKQKHLPHGVVTAEKVPNLDLASHPTGIRAVALSSDDSLACTVSKNVTQVWNVRTRRCIHTMTASNLIRGGKMAGTTSAASSTVYGLCAVFLPGNSHVVVGTREGHLLLLDIRAGEVVFSHEKAHDGAIWSIDLTRTGSSLDDSSFSIVTGSADHTVKFWVLESESEDDEDDGENRTAADQPVLVHVRTLELKDDVVAVRYSHSAEAAKRLIFVATLDNTIKVFFDDSLKLFLNLYGHSLPALAVDSSDDDSILATGGADKTVKIWGLDFGDTHRTMHGHEDSITDLRFVRHTHNFFTSSKDFTVRYWDGDRFEQILVLQGHSAEVNCLAVSRSGAFVLSGGMDRQIRVWERTKDIVFLEEERERALEQVFDRVGARDTAGTASILERKDDESDDGNANEEDQPQSEAAVQRSVLSVAAGDRLLEGLERADQELKDTIAWKKANGPDKPKQPNPLLLGLEPAHYVLWLLKTIKSAELEQSLLVLPLTHIERLVYYCTVLLRHGRGTELCAKVSVFLVKTHQNQIANNASMATPLRELRRLVRLRLSEARDVVGYNLAALKLVARIAQDKKDSLPVIEDSPSADIWAGLGLGSDVAAALERKSGSKRRR